MSWLIASVLIIGLYCIPLAVSLHFGEQGFSVYCGIGPFRFCVTGPDKHKKDKSHEKSATVKKSGVSHHAPPKSEKDKGGSFLDFLPVIRVGAKFLNSLRKRLTVKLFRLHIVLAGGNPAKLGIRYGQTWAAVSSLTPQLHRFLNIRHQDIDVGCDFENTQTRVLFETCIKITFGRLFCMVLFYGMKALWHIAQLKKLRKGGAQI